MDKPFQLNGFYTASQKRRFSGALLTRVSCRRYEGTLPTDKWSALCYAASRCTLKGVRIVLGGCDEGFFKAALLPQNSIAGATRFAALIADTRVEHHALLAGISGEAFVLTCQDNGIATCWVSQSYKKKECPIMLAPNEQLMCVIALGLQKPDGKEASPKKRKPPERLVKEGRLFAYPPFARQAVEAVRLAPSHQNIQPWEMSFTGSTLFFYGQERHRLEMGIALLHAEAAITQKHVWRLAQGEKNLVATVQALEE